MRSTVTQASMQHPWCMLWPWGASEGWRNDGVDRECEGRFFHRGMRMRALCHEHFPAACVFWRVTDREEQMYSWCSTLQGLYKTWAGKQFKKKAPANISKCVDGLVGAHLHSSPPLHTPTPTHPYTHTHTAAHCNLAPALEF